MTALFAFGVTPAVGLAASESAAQGSVERSNAEQPSAAQVSATASPPPALLRARFEQERHVPGFNKPLRSSGEVLMIRGEGLRWETTAPFPSVMIVRGDTMRVRDAQGREQRVGEGGGAAVPRLLQDLLGALLAKDRVALARHFDVEGEPTDDGSAWRMRLVPKAGPLANLYQRIEVEGTTHVERIELHGRDGGRTLLRFHDTRVAASADDAERRALD